MATYGGPAETGTRYLVVGLLGSTRMVVDGPRRAAAGRLCAVWGQVTGAGRLATPGAAKNGIPESVMRRTGEDVNAYAAPATAAAFSAPREAPLDQRDSAVDSAERSMGLVR